MRATALALGLAVAPAALVDAQRLLSHADAEYRTGFQLARTHGYADEQAEAERALIAHASGDCEEALTHLNRAARTAEVELIYGRCYEELGRTDEAINHYRAAIEEDASNGTARFRLGNLLLRAGRREEGLAVLDRYEIFRQWERRVKLMIAMVSSDTLPPEDVRLKTLELIGLYMQGGAFDEASETIEAGLLRFPDDPALRTARARWQLATGEVGASRASIVELLQEPRPPKDALWLSARFHLRDGLPAQAVADFERYAARTASPPATLLKEWATALAMQGDAARAVLIFERAIATDPTLASAHTDLGLLLESLGKTTEAETRYREALSIEPTLVSAQQGLGSLLLARGELESAEALFRRSTQFEPSDPALRHNLALVLTRLGRDDEARAQLEIARSLER